MKRYQMSRRALLRGLGVSMALPWMESIRVWGDESDGGDVSSSAPTRMAVLFSGCGFHSKEWWARGQGKAMELGKVLQPLENFKEQMVFIRGLYNAEALKGNIHSSQTGNLLSGAPLASGGDIRSGTSVDQFVAQSLGTQTKLPSLVLGCEKSNPSVHKNYSMLYSSHISWSSPTTPTPLEVYPALAFDQLFKDSAQKGDQSVLDAVLEDAGDVRRKISRMDQRKLDEYLNSVREVEQRIERAGNRGELQGWRPTLTKPDMARPADGYPQDIVEHMRLMSDILVLAFQTDTTRVCTLKLNNDHGTLRFPHLGVDYMIHHLLSHSDSEDWLKVNQFFLEQVAYIAGRLDRIQEGERTALENSMVVLCSSMLNGHHDASQLPVVLLGGGGGRIQGGQNLDYLGKDDRQMCRLFLSMMDKMDIHVDQFGDAKEPLMEV
ncbi:MAG: DUF1552 domain-containing protein [Planctomycetota bacterium]|jgi:hypothetical protein|nr:DUF1552 domain-containing protein [Planctomycetota bacterium]MEC7717023.1 DUF1552 domain-containing protein [Planctomycetota bacterium]MEC8305006.1 DUF1552 domain-containing protein [Planctomycetota bacterium]MEC8781929.1 DUF1552 domain-containing protein [Planctomycetota bacterium]MEE3032984.1 DUF1552 domain-containing protein [Planctomycetota bacterium]